MLNPQKFSVTCLASSLLTLSSGSPLVPRDNSNVGLHWASNSTCDPNAVTQITAAMADAVTLSNSAITALSRPDSNPAAYFFPESFASQATQVFQTVNMAIAPDPTKTYQNLNLIYLYCEDLLDQCGPGVWGYVPSNYNPATGQGSENQPAEFVVCPAMLALPRNPPSCTGTPGQATLGWAFLRTFVQLRSVQPGYAKLAARGIADIAPGLSASHQLATQKGGQSDQNADNFAQLATWSSDLGVTSDGSQCPANCAMMGPDAAC